MSAAHIFPFLLLIAAISGLGYDEGFLDGSCEDAQDCYILDNVNEGLWLSCWYNVGKCKCRNTIMSDYTLLWEDGKCLQSKYGPCGKKGVMEVGCQEGFQCLNNRCVDPVSPTTIKPVPFVFDRSCKGGCIFSDELELDCDRHTRNCMCRKQLIMDKAEDNWDIRNYDGSRVCSVGKDGPCGNKNGIEIECHGDGVSCQDGVCV